MELICLTYFLLCKIFFISDSELFDIKKVWRLGGKNKDDDANAFRWKNLNLLEESISLCWVNQNGHSIFDKHKISFLQIIKSSNKEEVHKLFIVVCLTIIMLSHTNDICLELIAKTNEDSDHNSLMPQFLTVLVQKFSEYSGIEKYQEIQASPTTKRRDRELEYNNPDSYALYEKIHKLENDLMCKFRS